MRARRKALEPVVLANSQRLWDKRQVDGGRANTALAVADLNTVHALDLHLVHLGRDRVIAVAGQPVDAAADDEVGAEILGGAEQLVNVALTVADMHAPTRRSEQSHGLAHVVEPADTLLLLDRHSCGIDLTLERSRALELAAATRTSRPRAPEAGHLSSPRGRRA